jgi:hypothetical protein
LAIGDRMGTNYKAGNYQIQIHAPQKEIKIKYQDNIAMVVYISTCEALLIDRSFTLKQYQVGLAKSINILTDQEQQREQQHQAEPEPEQLEQSEQSKQELELSQDTIVDDSEIIIDDAEIITDDLKIDFTKPTKPSLNQNLSRSSCSEWNR